MKKLLISLILVSNINIYSMEKNNSSYISLKSEHAEQDKQLANNNLFNQKNGQHITINMPNEQVKTVYQQNNGLVLPGNWVVITNKNESTKARLAKYVCKTYCAPRAFKECACGMLAIVFMVSLYKIYNIIESMSDPSTLGNN